MRKRARIPGGSVPQPNCSKPYLSQSPPTVTIAAASTSSSYWNDAPFSPCSDSDLLDHDQAPQTNDHDDTLPEFDSKLVLSYSEPPMTPPHEPWKPDKSSTCCKSPLRVFRAEPTSSSLDDKELVLFTDFDTCLRLGKSSRRPSAKRVRSRTCTNRTTTSSKSQKHQQAAQIDRKFDKKLADGPPLPCEIWILVLAYLPPKSMSRMMKTCIFFSNIAFDQIYWKAACANAGVDCGFVIQQAEKEGIKMSAFSLASPFSKKVIGTTSSAVAAEDLSIHSLEINDKWSLVLPSTGSKRRLNEVIHPLVTEVSSTSIQPRQRRKISTSLTNNNSNTNSDNSSILSEKLKWWWKSAGSLYPSHNDFHEVQLPRQPQPLCLSWFRVYATQHRTRSTFLQSPYSFRRKNFAHSHGVTCLERLDDGTLLAGSWDGTLTLWRIVETAPLSLRAKEELDGVRWDEIVDGRWGRCASSAASRRLVTGGEDEDDAEDSVWLNGIENDRMGIGELVAEDEVIRSRQSSPISMDHGSQEHFHSETMSNSWAGCGRFELELIKSFDAPYPVECMSIHGNFLVTGGRGRAPLTLWALTPHPRIIQSLVADLPTPLLNIPTSTHVTYIHTTSNLVATAQKQLIQLWDPLSGCLLAAIVKHHDSNTSSVRLVPKKSVSQGWWVIEACAFGSIGVWELEHVPHHSRPQPLTARTWTGKPIPDPSRSPLEEEKVFECTLCGPIAYVGSFETTSGINNAQVRETGADGIWNLLCGFKDGNVRSWVVEVSKKWQQDEIGGNKLIVTATGSLCSLGDWITWLDEDAVADIVVAGAWDGRIRVWDKRKRALRRSLVSDIRSAVLCLKVIGNILIAGSYNGSIVVYDFRK